MMHKNEVLILLLFAVIITLLSRFPLTDNPFNYFSLILFLFHTIIVFGAFTFLLFLVRTVKSWLKTKKKELRSMMD